MGSFLNGYEFVLPAFLWFSFSAGRGQELARNAFLGAVGRAEPWLLGDTSSTREKHPLQAGVGMGVPH